jgi:ATP-binding cassette subfamily G (WHITE) protein 2 (SNQ2)
MLSRYQAGEGIYDLFDKVMVLDQGRTVYFGPPDQARAYFERLGYRSLPRQSTADYLTGCTDPNERQFAPGVSENDAPSTPEALEAAFQNSDLARDVADDLSKYKLRMETEKIEQDAFRAAVADDKKKGVPIKSPYTLGLKDQVVALTRRQFQKRLQDKFQIYTSYGFMTVSDMPHQHPLREVLIIIDLDTRSLYWRLLPQPTPYIRWCIYSW